MESLLITDVHNQITLLQQALAITESLKEKCTRLENEKIKALQKCDDLEAKLEKLNKKKCTNCSFLMNELKRERKEKEKLKKEEKAKLLKTIAKTLESLDDGNTNQMTNAHQLFTELVCGRIDKSLDQKDKIGFSIIEDKEDSEEGETSNILVNDTVIENDSQLPTRNINATLIIPESQIIECSTSSVASKKDHEETKTQHLRSRNKNDPKGIEISLDQEHEIHQSNKRYRMSPVLSNVNEKLELKGSPHRLDFEKLSAKKSIRSPSVLSDISNMAGSSLVPRSNESSDCQEEKDVAWKMKPSVLHDTSNSSVNGKKLKQMTLSLTRAMQKKHDITLSEDFKGGVAKSSDDDSDVIQPSPETSSKKLFSKSRLTCETLEDPDMTVFNPGITSTCIPSETSYDRLPEVSKSPPYKYRRDTVRKRAERLKLPGQDCDQCARYYEAAGLDKTQEIRNRLNQCSRHRDKYQLRVNTPPGFWDPVLPSSPEMT